MNRLVVDASALAAVAFQEPRGEEVAGRLEGATLYAPTLLQFELTSAAWKKIRRHPEAAPAVLTALGKILSRRWPINWREVNHTDAALMALETGLSVYDASYLWLAGSLAADLVTLDERLARASEALSQFSILNS